MIESDGVGETFLSDIDKSVHPFDFDPSANNGYEGGKFAKPIKNWLKEHSIFLPSEAQLLGLGAGIANPECSLAQLLEIPYKNVTLVDKNPQIANHPILTEHRPGVKYLAGRGIFNYLENPDRKDFSVVTAIGLEYLLENQKIMEYFIGLLPKIVLPNSFVCVYPVYDETNNPEGVWEKNGFVRVELGEPRDYAYSLLYTYANPIK